MFEELLEERGLQGDHTTVWRGVQRYGPEEWGPASESVHHNSLKWPPACPANDIFSADSRFVPITCNNAV
jgi:hypothetical protein